MLKSFFLLWPQRTMGWQNQIGWLVNSSCCPVHVAQWLGKAISLCKLNLPFAINAQKFLLALVATERTMGWQNQIGWLVNSCCCPVHVAQWLGKAISLCKLNLPSAINA